MLTNDQMKLTLFEGFNAEELDELRRIIEVAQFSAGEAILRQNHRATNLYIVVNGEVEITHKPYDAPAISVGRLTPGGVFGWSSILGREVYSSTVTTNAPTTVYRIQAYKLQQFCELHHETGVVLLEKIAMSVAQQPAKIHEQIMSMINLAMTCREDD